MSHSDQPITTRQAAATDRALVSERSIIDRSPTRVVQLLGDRQLTIDPDVSTDARISLIARRQFGRVSRKQLIEGGVPPAAIGRRLVAGRLIREHQGVYALPQTSELPLGAESAALLACGPAAALGDHTAAVLWRMRAGTARPVHVVIPAGRGPRNLAGVQIHRSATLTPADIRLHENLPLTSPARTLLDIAAHLPDRDLERILDEAMFALRIVRTAEIRDVLSRAGGHPGRGRLARTASEHTSSTRTESPPEEQMLLLIRAGDLPDPELQANVLGYRLDFYWPQLRLAVEVDSYGTHGSRTRFESDRRRDARLLTELGILVIRFTTRAIEERPIEVIARLARTIGQREAELRR